MPETKVDEKRGSGPADPKPAPEVKQARAPSRAPFRDRARAWLARYDACAASARQGLGASGAHGKLLISLETAEREIVDHYVSAARPMRAVSLAGRAVVACASGVTVCPIED